MITRRLTLTVFIAVILINVSTSSHGTEKSMDDSAQSDTLSDKIDNLTQRLKGEAIISGSFTQLRFAKDLKTPLSSNGHFIYWRDKGIYWQTNAPFPQAITYTTQKTIHWKSPGVPIKSKKNNRRDKHFREILLSLFSFDTDLLEEKFSTLWDISDQQWELELTPINTLTRRALDNARLSGNEYVQHIVLVTSQGNKLDMTFSDVEPLNEITHQQCTTLFGLSINRCNDLVGKVQ